MPRSRFVTWNVCLLARLNARVRVDEIRNTGGDSRSIPRRCHAKIALLQFRRIFLNNTGDSKQLENALRIRNRCEEVSINERNKFRFFSARSRLRGEKRDTRVTKVKKKDNKYFSCSAFLCLNKFKLTHCVLNFDAVLLFKKIAEKSNLYSR